MTSAPGEVMAPPHTAGVEFAYQLFGDPVPSGTRIALWSKQDKRSVYVAGAAEVAAYDGRTDIYISAALVPAGLGAGVRVKAQEAMGIGGAWLDIDVGKGAAPDRDAAIALAHTVAEPTLLINSGGGVHAWWLFDELWTFASDGDREHAARVIQGWQTLHQQTAKTLGYRIDSTFDLARLMRLPGTVNGKRERPARVVRLDHDGATYTQGDIAARALPAAPPVRAVAPAAPTAHPALPRLKFDTLAETHDPFIRAWEHDRPDLADQSDSAYDLSLVSIAAHAGWSDPELAALVREHRAKYGDPDKGRRADYVERTIRKARNATPEPPPSRPPKQDEQDAPQPPRDVPTVINEAGAREPAIDYLRNALSKEITGVTKSAEEDGLYTVMWQPHRDGEPHGPERRRTIGGTAKVRSPTVLSDLVAVITNEYPEIKIAKAKVIGSAIRKLAVLDDTGSSPQQQTRAWIAAFVNDTQCLTLDLTDDADRTKAVTEDHQSFGGTDGHLYLRAAALDSYIRTTLHISAATISYAEVCGRLRDLRFHRRAVTQPRDADGQKQRKYWVSPPGYDPKADD